MCPECGLSDTHKMSCSKRHASLKAIRDRIAGAVQFMHPTRGMVWLLKDGSIMSKEEYKKLMRQTWAFWLGGR